MRLPASLSIGTIETALAELDGAQTDTILTIPTRAEHGLAGGEAAAVQLLVSWAQRQRTAVIKSYASDAADEQLETLARQLFGLSAALIADETRSLKGEDLTASFRDRALERLKFIHGPNPRAASRGRQLEIVCADHLGYSFPSLLYNNFPDGSSKLKSRSAFLDLAELALRTTIQGAGYQSLPSALAPSLAGALYELFRNTEEHARFDVLGNRLNRSLRGIQIRHHGILARSAEGVFADSPPLASYFRRLGERSEGRQIQFVEVSIFDSGPGLGARWTKTPTHQLDSDLEYAAIEECFRKNATSKTASTAGLGLPTVIDILRKRDGLLRLRSGRFSLYADLSLQSKNAYGEMPEFSHWNAQRRLLAIARGALISLIFPLQI